MEKISASSKLKVGSVMPNFSLPAVDGKNINQSYLLGHAGLVIFACNHCPYVIGSIDSILHTISTYHEDGLKAVIISSNDPVQYPEDSFENMKKFAKEKNFPCPYLFDETQEVAKAFDAQCTPESFLFDFEGRLFYQGAVNDSHRDPSKVTVNYLDKAIFALLNNQELESDFNWPIGCSIKWKV